MSTEQKIVKNKIGLLCLAEELGNISRECKVMGYSRDTFYRYEQAVAEGDFGRHSDLSHRPVEWMTRQHRCDNLRRSVGR